MAKWLFPVMNFQRGCLNSRIRSHNSDLSAIERLCPPPAFLAVSVWQQVEGWGECFPEVWISAGCTFHAYPPKSELPIHLYRISHLSPCFSAQQRWKWTQFSNNKKTQANKWTNWKSLCSSDKKNKHCCQRRCWSVTDDILALDGHLQVVVHCLLVPAGLPLHLQYNNRFTCLMQQSALSPTLLPLFSSSFPISRRVLLISSFSWCFLLA